MCNVLCGYRILERTTLLVLSECLSISHIIAMQLLYHGLPPFKQDYHSRQVLDTTVNVILLLQVNVTSLMFFNYHDYK